MNPTLIRRNGFWLALSLVLMVVSSIVASVVQTSGYSVAVKNMSWETASAESMSALLFKPNSASPDNKVPAIIVSHGWWNNKEMQDANYVELAKRGYVVISIDMYGHGDSDYLTNSDLTLGGTGMYDAVKLAADLPYVSKIGVSGHSNGARAAKKAGKTAAQFAAEWKTPAKFVGYQPISTEGPGPNLSQADFAKNDAQVVFDELK